MMTEEDTFIYSVFKKFESDRKTGKLNKYVSPNGGYGISQEHLNHIARYNSEGVLIATYPTTDIKSIDPAE